MKTGWDLVAPAILSPVILPRLVLAIPADRVAG
jgi:hypothetical protein